MKKSILVILLGVLLSTSALFSQSVRIGDKAPDFTVTLTDGTSVTLSSLKGQAVFVHFWATWCPPCVRELPGLDKLSKKLDLQKNPKMKFLAVCVSDSKKNCVSFMKKNNYTFTCGLDENGNAAAYKYGVEGIPASFLVSSEGKILKIQVGMMPESELKDFIKGYEE